MIHLILGGARSGKSSYAEQLALEQKKVLYVATSQIYDEEMRHRVELHQRRRPSSWGTLEKYKGFREEDFSAYDVVLVDCLTLMITGIFFEKEVDHYTPKDFDELEVVIRTEIEQLLELLHNKNAYLVSNELGMGIVPEHRLSRAFRDIAGRMNQLVAKRADKVTLMVAGLPLEVK